MAKTYLYILLFFITLRGFGMSLNSHTKRNYRDSLLVLVKQIELNSCTSKNLLLFCIPRNSKETLMFCNLDYKKNKKYSKIFYKINQFWEKQCIINSSEFLPIYMEYSSFVDGYFAEDYFICLKRIFHKKKDSFMKILNDCKKEKVKRIYLHFREIDLIK